MSLLTQFTFTTQPSIEILHKIMGEVFWLIKKHPLFFFDINVTGLYSTATGGVIELNNTQFVNNVADSGGGTYVFSYFIVITAT
jgi:hypothetical protein